MAAMAERGIETLPQSLNTALDHFDGDSVIRNALGPIAGEFTLLKRDELCEYHSQVESWEFQR